MRQLPTRIDRRLQQMNLSYYTFCYSFFGHKMTYHTSSNDQIFTKVCLSDLFIKTTICNMRE